MMVNVLGTPYTIRSVDSGKDSHITENNLCGYCAFQKKEIVVLNLSTVEEWKKDGEEAIESQEKETIRHELVHAFLYESGLQSSGLQFEGSWARNEEMVDWIAIQFPKLIAAFKEAGAL